MGNSSSIVTGGLVISATALEPAVTWVFAGCHGPVPPAVVQLVAGVAATVLHAAYNFALRKFGGKAAAQS